jgi:hypothetical protein
MNTYWGSGVQLHAFFSLGTRWMWVVSFTPQPLYPQGKSPWYPMERGMGGPQSQSGRGGEEKNSQLLPGPEHAIIQPLPSAVPLSYPGSLRIPVPRYCQDSTLSASVPFYSLSCRSSKVRRSQNDKISSPLSVHGAHTNRNASECGRHIKNIHIYIRKTWVGCKAWYFTWWRERAKIRRAY